MSKKIQLKQGEEGQKKSGCLGAWYHEMIRLIFKSIRKRSFLKRPSWQPLFKICPSSPQKGRFSYVTICRVFRRGLLCLACLLAFKVVAQNQVVTQGTVPWVVEVDCGQGNNAQFLGSAINSIDHSNLKLYDIQNDVAQILTFSSQASQGVVIGNGHGGISRTLVDLVNGSYGQDSDVYDLGVLGLLDEISVNIISNLSQTTYYSHGRRYASLLGLLAGFSGVGEDAFTGTPLGTDTNGIWYFTKDLSDALHNTNSVFHRQLTAQETLTNQMERFITLQAQNMTNLIYGISPLMTDNAALFPNTFNPYRFMYYFPYGHTYSNSVLQNQRFTMLYSLGSQLFLNNISMLPYDLMADDDYGFFFDLDGEGYLPEYLQEISNAKYKYYGTKWGFDSITNILLSQDFDFNSISVVKPDVDDMIQDSTEEVQDSLPTSSEELESVPPGDYEEIQDERIDTSFLEEAKTDTTSIKFSEHLFDDFKNSYNGIFNFRSSSSLQYSFALQSSDGVNVTVNDTDMLGSAAQLLSEKKSTIDALIKIIIGLNKFICLVVFVGKAFKMVSEIFSS